MAVLIAHVKEGKEFPKDHSKQVEELQLHAAALPCELPDRQLLLDLSDLRNALANVAKGQLKRTSYFCFEIVFSQL